MDKKVDLDFLSDINLPTQEMSLLEKAHRDEALDEALRGTFPASDPIALNFSFPRTRLDRLRSSFRGAFR